MRLALIVIVVAGCVLISACTIEEKAPNERGAMDGGIPCHCFYVGDAGDCNPTGCSGRGVIIIQ